MTAHLFIIAREQFLSCTWHIKLYGKDIDSICRQEHKMLLEFLHCHPDYRNVEVRMKVTHHGKSISSFTYKPTIR